MFLSGMKHIHSKGADFGESHARVAPYVYQIRVTFVDDDSFNGFLTFCKACNLPRPIKVHVPMENSNDYSHPNFVALRKWFLTLDFRIAFQCEALIANSRVTPSQLLGLKPAIQRVILQYKSQPATCAHILRYFNDRVPNRKPGTPLLYFFEECSQKEEATRNTEAKGGLVHVHQVTFTPSAMRLEGPHLSNSNRVLRIYAEHHDNFVRVDFRDEEKMQFRWTTDIDGSTFVESHVGDILRNGFTLCGRKFEILGYSVSALREHAIWFLHPFTDSSGLVVDAGTIRDGLGDFHYKNVIACPATYGARMAQAFTATDATVTLEEHEWEMISDIERGRWNHTDGVGTMSPALQQRIWAELCKLWGLRDVTHNVPCVVSLQNLQVMTGDT
jgi:RNA-dependent RNA polymerase